MRSETVACDATGCQETHAGPWGDGHPTWAQIVGIGVADPETGRAITADVWLCPAHKARAAEAVLGPKIEPKPFGGALRPFDVAQGRQAQDKE